MYSSYANNFDLSSETLDKYEKTEFYKAFKKVRLLGQAYISPNLYSIYSIGG